MRRLTRELNLHEQTLTSLTEVLRVVVDKLGPEKTQELVDSLAKEKDSVQRLKEAETFSDLSTLKLPGNFRRQ